MLLSCEEVAGRGFVERYSSGRLAPDEVEAFESHYLTCGRCQQEIRLGVAIRAALRKRESRAQPVRPRSRVLPTAGSLAIAAGLAAILLLQNNKTTDVTKLGQVSEPPVYSGIPVRGATGPGDSLFADAMTEYAAHHYARAESGLLAALTAGVDRPAAEFFLGVSQLMQNKSRDAVDSFDRVIALGESVYLTETYFYRAKALLRLDRANTALEDLARASRRPHAFAPLTAALADSVKGVIQR
jgi:tetratricopeptide (TPR) repeat protein